MIEQVYYLQLMLYLNLFCSLGSALQPAVAKLASLTG